MNRRGFLATLAVVPAAPAIVRASSLMKLTIRLSIPTWGYGAFYPGDIVFYLGKAYWVANKVEDRIAGEVALLMAHRDGRQQIVSAPPGALQRHYTWEQRNGLRESHDR